jgi:Tfp pilus assembly protein PilN
MRAVNLIPADQQRGAGGAAGRSGGGVYIFLGALAVLLAMSAAYVLTGKSVDDKKGRLADLNRQAVQAEQRSQALADYTKFASVRTKREQTVQQLAQGRFDWAHALHEVARVLPANAWLTQLTGTTSPSVNLAAGGSSTLRAALAVPAVQVAGCTTSQSSVAKMMARMRLIDGVQRVSLQDSQKNDNAVVSTGSSAGGSGDCRGASSRFPSFDIVVFFQQPAGGVTPSSPGQAAGAAGAASTATPASASTASPSNTTTPVANGGSTP